MEDAGEVTLWPIGSFTIFVKYYKTVKLRPAAIREGWAEAEVTSGWRKRFEHCFILCEGDTAIRRLKKNSDRIDDVRYNNHICEFQHARALSTGFLEGFC